MLTKEQLTICVAWEKDLPRHVQREQIRRAHQFGSGETFSDKGKVMEVLQKTACLAEALIQLLEEKDAQP